MMIERALRKQTDIRAYIFALEGEKDEEKRIPADDILSNEDWRLLGEVNEILTPLYHQTMRTQGWGKGDSHGPWAPVGSSGRNGIPARAF
jgi:hypothetical protein